MIAPAIECKINKCGYTFLYVRRIGEAMTGGEILVKGNARLLAGVLNWGGKITIEGNTTLPGGKMKSGTIFVKGKVLGCCLLIGMKGSKRSMELRTGSIPVTYHAMGEACCA